VSSRAADGAAVDGTAANGTAAPQPDVDVLVVGGGPTGLLTACELVRRGVRVRVVERAPEPSPGPRRCCCGRAPSTCSADSA
jgi:NADPH-dependent 2,4-dienoyl-CoA reductase/sulfur reductase-like enzyme